MTVFDVPAPEIPRSPRSADWCKRLDAGANAGAGLAELGCSFGLVKDQSNDYSMPIETAPPGTPERRLFFRPGWPGKFVGAVGQRVPWRGSWHPARGRDGHACVIAEDDDGPDVEIDLWGLSSYEEQNQGMRPQSGVLGNIRNWLVWPRFDQVHDLVAASVIRTPLDGRTGDGFICSPLSYGVATAAEVASGHIGHALRISVSNPLAGPAAPKSYTDPDHPDIGTKYGLAGLPCGRHEGAGGKATAANIERLKRCVPHGLRVVGVDIDVDRWLDTGSSTGPATRAKLTGTLRSTMATIAECVAIEHGLVVAITTPADAGDANVQFDGSDALAWRDIGIVGDGREALHGLFGGPGTIRACAWPVATLPDGTTTSRATVGVVPHYAA